MRAAGEADRLRSEIEGVKRLLNSAYDDFPHEYVYSLHAILVHRLVFVHLFFCFESKKWFA